MRSHDRTLLSSLAFADPDKREARHDLACQYLAQPAIATGLVGELTKKAKGRIDWAVDRIEPEHHITKGEGKYQTTIGFADLLVGYLVLISQDEQPGRASYIKRQAEMWIESQLQEYDDRPDPILVEIEAKFKQLGPNCTWYSRPYDVSKREEWEALAEEHNSERDAKDAVRTKLKESLTVEATTREQKLLAQADFSWKAGQRHWEDEASGYTTSGVPGYLVIEVKVNPVPIGDVLRQLALYRDHVVFRRHSEDHVARQVLVTAYDLSTEDVATLSSKKIHHFKLGSGFEEYCQRRAATGAPAESLEI